LGVGPSDHRGSRRGWPLRVVERAGTSWAPVTPAHQVVPYASEQLLHACTLLLIPLPAATISPAIAKPRGCRPRSSHWQVFRASERMRSNLVPRRIVPDSFSSIDTSNNHDNLKYMFTRSLHLPKPGTETFFLWGPRQTGKTTLLAAAYPDALWIDLLKAEEFRRYLQNPELLRAELRPASPYARWCYLCLEERRGSSGPFAISMDHRLPPPLLSEFAALSPGPGQC
jgi:hypothetical protein